MLLRTAFHLLMAFILTNSAGLSLKIGNQDNELSLNSNLVNVPVIVSDRQGRYIAGLKAADFSVYQDGIKQKVSFFATEEEPLDIALMIDTSQSTKDVLSKIKKSAIEFLKQLRPRDKAMVVSFDRRINILSPLTSDRRALEAAIKEAKIPKRVGTVLRDAVIDVIKQRFAGLKERKAIIMLTDGKDHRSIIQTDELLNSVEESDTMIYSIYFETMPGISQGLIPFVVKQVDPIRRNQMEQNNIKALEFLQELSDDTAGRVYRSNATDFKGAFNAIANELRQRYFLGYYPEETQAGRNPHEIKVQVDGKDLAVRYRRYYRTELADSAASKKQ